MIFKSLKTFEIYRKVDSIPLTGNVITASLDTSRVYAI
jgi:hypothetical protein